MQAHRPSLLSNTHTVQWPYLESTCVCGCVCARACLSPMRITRPFCLVSCQTFGQGQSPWESQGGGGCGAGGRERGGVWWGGRRAGGGRGERSGGTPVNCTDRHCERTYNGPRQREEDRQREGASGREGFKQPEPWKQRADEYRGEVPSPRVRRGVPVLSVYRAPD